MEGEALRQLTLGLTYRQIAQVMLDIAHGVKEPASVGIELPSHVTFPPDYTLTHKRVHDLVQRALDRVPMLEAPAVRKLEMSRLEEMWARLQPGMRKGDVRSIEAGIRVMERKARLLGLDMPAKVAMSDPDGQGIPLETVRRVLDRVDRQMAEINVTPMKPAQIEGSTTEDDQQ
jgi:hypothetical protein